MALTEETADIVSPKPTNCAVLDDGDRTAPGVGLSATHALSRWTELSKLLDEDQYRSFLDHLETYLIYVEYILMKAACDTKM